MEIVNVVGYILTEHKTGVCQKDCHTSLDVAKEKSCT